MLDVFHWLEQHRIPISDKRTAHNKITYTLSSCPWNSQHGTSAVVEQDQRTGQVTARCSHPECKYMGWQDLKKLYQGKEDNFSPADLLVNHIESSYTLFKTQHGIPYMLGSVPIRLDDNSCHQHLRLLYRELTGKTLSNAQVDTVAKTVAAMAMACNDVRYADIRVVCQDEQVFYDLIKDNQMVVIDDKGVGIENNADCRVIFECTADMLQQVMPDLSVEPKELRRLLFDIFPVPSHQQLLFLAYLVIAFYPAIPRPILLVTGEKGAAKSSLLQYLSKLIDPTPNELCPLPSLQDIPSTISNAYYTVFDNARSLTPEINDTICLTVTGGSVKKRKLFTDNNLFSCTIQRLIAISGIDFVNSLQSDLIDRSIILKLSRIEPSKRLTKLELDKRFVAIAPKILGGCFNTLSRALAIYPTACVNSLPRMADFAKMGWCVAEAINKGQGDIFLAEYEQNQLAAIEENICNNVFVDALISFIQENTEWAGSVSEFYIVFKNWADSHMFNVLDKDFPKAPNFLSRKLNQAQSDLLKMNIIFSITNTGNFKTISISKKIK